METNFHEGLGELLNPLFGKVGVREMERSGLFVGSHQFETHPFYGFRLSPHRFLDSAELDVIVEFEKVDGQV